jgi:NADPH:quinone reductase
MTRRPDGTIAARMRAWQLTSLRGPEGLELVELPDPEPSHFSSPGRGVVIDVHAAGIAFPDVLMTRGGYQDQPVLPYIPGIEVAGVVAATSGAELEVGQRVAAYTQIGALAEKAVAPVVSTFPLPPELDFAEGAGLVVNYHTAYFGLRTRAGLRAGETVLVHGAGGGLGSAALQIARGLGARSIAVVSSEEKGALARRAGANEVVRVDGPWPQAVRELAGGAGVDLAFDPVGGDRALDSLRLLREDGRLLIVGFASGLIPEVRVNRLVLRNASVVGAGYGAYIAARPDQAAAIGDAVSELIQSGEVRPLIGRRFSFEDAAEAFRLIDRRGALGKIVVELRQDRPR